MLLLIFLIFFAKTCTFIGLDKSGYQVNIFLISPRKHMLWLLSRSSSETDSSASSGSIYLFIIQNPLASIIWMLYAHGVLVV